MLIPSNMWLLWHVSACVSGCYVATVRLEKPFIVQAPGGHELPTDFWELVGSSPAGGVESVVNESSNIDIQLDQRHLMLRGETVSQNLPT